MLYVTQHGKSIPSLVIDVARGGLLDIVAFDRPFVSTTTGVQFHFGVRHNADGAAETWHERKPLENGDTQ